MEIAVSMSFPIVLYWFISSIIDTNHFPVEKKNKEALITSDHYLLLVPGEIL